MSEELFPDENANEYEYEDDEDKKLSIKQRLSEAVDSFGEKILSQDNEDNPDKDEGSIFSDEGEDDKEKSKLEKMDRFSWLLVSIEIVLVLYLFLAILGLVPFF